METIQDFLDSLYAEYRVVAFRGGRLIRGKVKELTADALAELRRRLGTLGWLHSLETIDGAQYLTCTVMDRPIERRRGLHFVLFALTVLTTMIGGGDLGFGAFYVAGAAIIDGMLRAAYAVVTSFPHVSLDTVLRSGLGQVFAEAGKLLAVMAAGIPFSFAILTILGCHEMGHYVAARRHGMNVTLPYFIPVPIGIGTLGALIRIRSPLIHRRMVMDVGAAGPLAGAVASIIFLAIGVAQSQIGPITGQGIPLGDSILTRALVWLVQGPIPPGLDVHFHPFAFAGWIGLLITAINLLPIGQLDGGHVAYALFGPLQRRLATMTFGMLITFGLIGFFTSFQHGSWPYLFFAVLTRSFMKSTHPPALDASVKLGARRTIVGIICLILLVVCFVPSPFN